MAYLYLLLSAACSVFLAHLLKITQVRQLRTLPTLTASYLFASLAALAIGYWQQGALQVIPQIATIVFCVIVGALFIGNFLMYSTSVHANGMGVTVAAMRTSLMIPIWVSVLWYGEALSFLTMGGIILAAIALLLLIPWKSSVRIGTVDAGWLLILIFCVSGLADASLKIYEETFRTALHELIFMSMVFGSAFLIGCIAMVIQKIRIFTAREIAMGCIIGIPNLYSSIFLIYALTGMDGALAYMIVNVLNVVAGTAIGYLFWKDDITFMQCIGLIIAIFGIIFFLRKLY